MNKRIPFIISILIFCQSSFAQLQQVARYEIEKDLLDDFSAVVTHEDKGVVIIRDINKKFTFGDRSEGDEWELRVLNNELEETWVKEFEVDYDYVFAGFDLTDNTLYMLYKEGQYEKSKYILLTTDLVSQEQKEYIIENDLSLIPYHLTIYDETLLMAGYVKNSPTVVRYIIGESASFEVIPGYFKDRSDILDLRVNSNGTFNVLTQEKEFNGYYLRLRTYGADGVRLFERLFEVEGRQKVLSGRVTDFVDGNLRVCGIYGGKNSYYARGIYFGVVRPEGQDNDISFVDFTEMGHFFDYMGERRSARIKRKIERKRSAGKEYKFSTRVTVNDIKYVGNDFYINAEVYDPILSRNSTALSDHYASGFSTFNTREQASDYRRQSNPLINVDDASKFKFLSSIILKFDKKNKLLWDESFSIDNIENESLEPITDWSIKNDRLNIIYRDEEEIKYKIFVDADSSYQDVSPINLKYENDEIKYTYELIGGSKHFYENNFIIWGNHKVGNKDNPDVDRRRNLLYVNKVQID